jgi:formylglycine-generating enzyme required for sulfatase activity
MRGLLFCLLLSFICPNTYAQDPKEITNSIGMKLVLIPKGTFMMGSPIEEEGRGKDEEQHQVTISEDYYLGVTEVTQGQYEKVMGTNPGHFQKGPSVGATHPFRLTCFLLPAC